MPAGGDELKLLGMWASPFVMRVKLALSFKGLSYDDVEEDLFGGKSELLLKSNPVHKKVPVLLHNGKPVCESQIIVQYIDEAFAGTGPSLLPTDPYERAIARFWGAYIDDKRDLLSASRASGRHEYIEEDLSNKSDLLLSSNPVHKKVPVLIHNSKPVCESQIIVQYVDEVYRDTGLSFLPADPYERARARFWAAFIDDKLLASWVQASRGKTMEEKMELLKPTFAAVETLEEAFRECSKGKPFFGGDNVGYLDVMLGGLVAWVHASETRHGLKIFDSSRSPLLNAWVDRFSKLDETKAVLPDIQRLLEYAKMREAQAAAAN
ncbi:unnamed protein product [Urochloa decumbens]|uniref:glutathione transferase n=1 Tax=Urochloa decumbens TaxID=240449 RepID=A0ABC8XAE5_9POAL